MAHPLHKGEQVLERMWSQNKQHFFSGILVAVAVFGKLAGAYCVDCSLPSTGLPLESTLSQMSAPVGGWSAYPELGQVMFDRFDPHFRASYWNEKDGIIDAEDAPWNQTGAWSDCTPFNQPEFVERAQELLSPFFPQKSSPWSLDSAKKLN